MFDWTRSAAHGATLSEEEDDSKPNRHTTQQTPWSGQTEAERQKGIPTEKGRQTENRETKKRKNERKEGRKERKKGKKEGKVKKER